MVNVLFSRVIAISRKDILFCFLRSVVNDMLACRPLRKLWKASKCLGLEEEEIHHKKSDIRVLKKEFSSSHSSLQHEISFIDFAHVSSLFLRSNNRILASKSAIQQKKLSNLVKSSISMHDLGKVIFNFSKYGIADYEKRLLVNGLNFSLPPKYLDYADYLVNFELFYRNIHNLGILSNEDLDFVKTRTKEAALSSYRNYNNMYHNTFLKKSFLLYKIYVKIKILLSRNLIKVILLWLLTKQII